jgi:hypothetical protein
MKLISFLDCVRGKKTYLSLNTFRPCPIIVRVYIEAFEPTFPIIWSIAE